MTPLGPLIHEEGLKKISLAAFRASGLFLFFAAANKFVSLSIKRPWLSQGLSLLVGKALQNSNLFIKDLEAIANL